MMRLMVVDPVTAVSPTKRNDAYLVSTLDSKMRLMDKASGKLLQTFEAETVSYLDFWNCR
jgi:hypothetical protein